MRACVRASACMCVPRVCACAPTRAPWGGGARGGEGRVSPGVGVRRQPGEDGERCCPVWSQHLKPAPPWTGAGLPSSAARPACGAHTSRLEPSGRRGPSTAPPARPQPARALRARASTPSSQGAGPRLSPVLAGAFWSFSPFPPAECLWASCPSFRPSPLGLGTPAPTRCGSFRAQPAVSGREPSLPTGEAPHGHSRSVWAFAEGTEADDKGPWQGCGREVPRPRLGRGSRLPRIAVLLVQHA